MDLRTITFRAPADLALQARLEAARQDISVSELIRQGLEAILNDFQKNREGNNGHKQRAKT